MPLPLNEGSWTLDPAHSTVGFSVRHLGISSITGRFGDVAATLAVGADLDSSSLEADIQMASVDTGNEARDGHLQSTDFFSAEAQPTMSFRSNGITETGDGRYSVAGDLTVNGRTNSETLDVQFFGTAANPLDGSTRAGFSAQGTIDRTKYGIEWNVPLEAGGVMLGHDIDLQLNVQLVGPSD